MFQHGKIWCIKFLYGVIKSNGSKKPYRQLSEKYKSSGKYKGRGSNIQKHMEKYSKIYEQRNQILTALLF